MSKVTEKLLPLVKKKKDKKRLLWLTQYKPQTNKAAIKVDVD